MPRVVDIVIPTVGRPSLAVLLDGLARSIDGSSTPPGVFLVDDRPSGDPLLPRQVGAGLRVLRSRGRGPAAARNVGWRVADAEWVAFLDDDVEVTAGWWPALLADLAGQPPEVAGVQG